MKATIYTQQCKCCCCGHVFSKPGEPDELPPWRSVNCPACGAEAGNVDVVTEDIEIRCPECGADRPDRIAYYEDVVTERRVLGADEDGTFRISGESRITDYDSGGRFGCLDCMTEFPIPRGLSIEWDD